MHTRILTLAVVAAGLLTGWFGAELAHAQSVDRTDTHRVTFLARAVTIDAARGDWNDAKTDASDLSTAWRVNQTLTVRAGVNNLLDQDPPITSQPIVGIGEPNAYPTYDLLGRQIFISATAKF